MTQLRRSFLPIVSLIASSVVACERTAEGIKQDTQALATTVNEKGAAAERELDTEISAFKAEAEAKLADLAMNARALEAKAEHGIDRSKEELGAQIEQTKSELANLKANSQAEWQETKAKLNARIADFGKRVNATLDRVGDDVDEAGDEIEQKVE